MTFKKKRRVLTDFGLETLLFTKQHGMNLKELAAAAGVSYNTFIDVRTGRSTGHDVIPKVRTFMANCSAQKGGVV